VFNEIFDGEESTDEKINNATQNSDIRDLAYGDIKS